MIRTEVNRKKFNVTSEYSGTGGIAMYNTISFAFFKPNLGPLVKLHLNCVPTNQNGTESKLNLKRVNGVTFKVHLWFTVFFILISLILATYLILIENDIGFNMLMIPLFGLFYALIIELVAELTIESLKKKVEKILKSKNVHYKKE